MPAKSKAQQRFFGLVRSVQKGDTPKKKVSKKVRDAARKMKVKDVRDFASTKTKKLPEKVGEAFVRDMIYNTINEMMKNRNVTRLTEGRLRDIISEEIGRCLLDEAVNPPRRILSTLAKNILDTVFGIMDVRITSIDYVEEGYVVSFVDGRITRRFNPNKYVEEYDNHFVMDGGLCDGEITLKKDVPAGSGLMLANSKD